MSLSCTNDGKDGVRLESNRLENIYGTIEESFWAFKDTLNGERLADVAGGRLYFVAESSARR
jgi:hypothetical protein